MTLTAGEQSPVTSEGKVANPLRSKGWAMVVERTSISVLQTCQAVPYLLEHARPVRRFYSPIIRVFVS